MATPGEHYEEAERLLAEGVTVMQRLSATADDRLNEGGDSDEMFDALTGTMDELGKKAMGIWAQAQVHATLANLSMRDEI